MTRKKQFAGLLLMTALLFGGIIRFAAPASAQGPVNDGGLFLQMTRDLQANNFALPRYTTYNDADIPFAYPPLGFYLAGFLQSLSGVSLYALFTYLPAVFSTLAILSFHFLALELTRDSLEASLAALLYAVVPKSFDWFIMGGGTVRALGLILSFLTLKYAYRLFVSKDSRFVLPLSICASLLVLTHPETAFHTAFSALVFAVFFLRGRRSVFDSILAVALVAAFTSPWWLVALMRHGIGPFQSAFGVGVSARDLPTSLLYFFQFNLSGEVVLALVAVLGLIGLVSDLRSRRFFLIAWIGLSFLVDPRAAPLASLTPLILLAVKGFESTLTGLGLPGQFANGFESRAARGVLLGLVAYTFMSGIISSMQIGNEFRILPQERESLAWVAQNTPQGSRFLILTGEAGLSDPLSEWFPTLTGRVSLLTAQGHEWTPGSPLIGKLREYNNAQSCLEEGQDCISAWDFDYLYVRTLRPTREGGAQDRPSILGVSLRASPEYRIVFENEAAAIYQPVR